MHTLYIGGYIYVVAVDMLALLKYLLRERPVLKWYTLSATKTKQGT